MSNLPLASCIQR